MLVYALMFTKITRHIFVNRLPLYVTFKLKWLKWEMGNKSIQIAI